MSRTARALVGGVPSAGRMCSNSNTLTGSPCGQWLKTTVPNPVGQITTIAGRRKGIKMSLLNASETFTLPQLASLLPLIDGELVEQFMVVATTGGASTLTLITRSGTERRAEELPLTDQAQLALAWVAFGRDQ